MLMNAFVRAVATGDPSHIATGARDALDSHIMVFEAERSRVENRVVNLIPVWEKLDNELTHKHTMEMMDKHADGDDLAWRWVFLVALKVSGRHYVKKMKAQLEPHHGVRSPEESIGKSSDEFDDYPVKTWQRTHARA